MDWPREDTSPSSNGEVEEEQEWRQEYTEEEWRAWLRQWSKVEWLHYWVWEREVHMDRELVLRLVNIWEEDDAVWQWNMFAVFLVVVLAAAWWWRGIS